MVAFEMHQRLDPLIFSACTSFVKFPRSTHMNNLIALFSFTPLIMNISSLVITRSCGTFALCLDLALGPTTFPTYEIVKGIFLTTFCMTLKKSENETETPVAFSKSRKIRQRLIPRVVCVFFIGVIVFSIIFVHLDNTSKHLCNQEYLGQRLHENHL